MPWGPFIFPTHSDLIDYASVACDNKQGDLQYCIPVCKYDMGNYLTQGITQQVADWRDGGGGEEREVQRVGKVQWENLDSERSKHGYILTYSKLYRDKKNLIAPGS